MNRKPPELPNIEDATLRACLAPLMDAMNNRAVIPASAVPASTIPAPVMPAHVIPAAAPPADSLSHKPDFPRGPTSSNDNPQPPAEPVASRDPECPVTPRTLSEWRSLADDDFGAFRMIELFLGMTDAELEAAAAEFPKQIGTTAGRIHCLKKRLATQYDAVTTVTALLERAMARAAARAEIDDQPATEMNSTRDSPVNLPT